MLTYIIHRTINCLNNYYGLYSQANSGPIWLREWIKVQVTQQKESGLDNEESNANSAPSTRRTPTSTLAATSSTSVTMSKVLCSFPIQFWICCSEFSSWSRGETILLGLVLGFIFWFVFDLQLQLPEEWYSLINKVQRNSNSLKVQEKKATILYFHCHNEMFTHEKKPLYFHCHNEIQSELSMILNRNVWKSRKSRN